jgi:hypothetical protein
MARPGRDTDRQPGSVRIVDIDFGEKAQPAAILLRQRIVRREGRFGRNITHATVQRSGDSIDRHRNRGTRTERGAQRFGHVDARVRNAVREHHDQRRARWRPLALFVRQRLDQTGARCPHEIARGRDLELREESALLIDGGAGLSELLAARAFAQQLE